MIFGNIILRVTTALAFVSICNTQELRAKSKKEVRPLKYPLQIHQMYRDQISKKIPKTVGEWSDWSPWSPCSRSCGGGITQQTRHCTNRPADSRFARRQRRRRQNGRLGSGCVGLYKRIHLCNNQECSSGGDFRLEQCAAFNHRPFKGRRYYWEPFLKVKDECALHCRAAGMNFFATLNRTVIDGTPCSYPMISTGRAAPRGTRGVCIEGLCKSVNSRGVIGSIDDNQEECAACLKGTCRSINGFYTRPDLPPGYSLVTQIPPGACRIFIQQLKHTKNVLALKNSNGSFIVNGEWKFSNSRALQGAGAKFIYVRQDENSLETLSSPGPLANTVDVMIVNYQANPGIKYSYSLPINEQPVIAPPLVKRPYIDPTSLETKRLDSSAANTSLNQKDEARPPLHPGPRRTRTRRKYFHWKVTGLTACSKPCGGGIQTYVKTCYKELHPHNIVPVNDRRCSHLENPASEPVRCNMDPCPPTWEGYWTECSSSCGEGIQEYILQCKQDLATGAVVVNGDQCPQPKPSGQTRPCRERDCESSHDNELPQIEDPRNMREWSVGPWSQCSVTCDTGHKTRQVTCPSGQCPPEDRPAHAEYCILNPCDSPSGSRSSSPSTRSLSTWLLTEWSQCSEFCGTGTQTRLTVCGTGNQNECDSDSRPELFRACSSDKQCGGEWFTGPWGQCSDSCAGRAKQKREVFCIVKIRGQSHITNEKTCPVHNKPIEEQPCDGVCPPHWFMGDWGPCEGNCPAGVQRREVRCLDHHGKQANGCPETDMPVAKRTCACRSKTEPRDRYKPAQDEPSDRSCVDRIRKCRLAVQARLCHYPYYVSHCCESCRKAQQGLLE